MNKTPQMNEQHLLHALLENSPDFIFFKDRQSRFILTNDAHAQQLMNLRNAQEAVGKTDFDLFKREEAQRFYDEEQKIMETGQPVIAREWALHSSTTDQEVWLSEHKLPIRDETGRVAGLLGVARDITQLKRSEGERDRLLTVLERRSLQLQAAADVSIVASSSLDPDTLIRQVLDLLRERFDLYYVGLFLVDQTMTLSQRPGEWAALQAGTGEVGNTLVQQKQRLKVGGDSMIGQCIASRQARIEMDVDKETARFENPLLPDTRSEMALPLVVRGEVIGALTIQSTQKAAFAQGDIAVLQTVANQLANAIENARLFTETEGALKELENVHRSYLRRGWDGYLKQGRSKP